MMPEIKAGNYQNIVQDTTNHFVDVNKMEKS